MTTSNNHGDCHRTLTYKSKPDAFSKEHRYVNRVGQLIACLIDLTGVLWYSISSASDELRGKMVCSSSPLHLLPRGESYTAETAEQGWLST